MSIVNAKTFLGRVERDPTARQRVAAMREGAEMTAMAAEMGLPCSVEEIGDVLRGTHQDAGRLSDRELDSVAGGAYAGGNGGILRLPSFLGIIGGTSSDGIR